MKVTCACCKGIHKSTPAQTANRPGLFALSYRVGTHATFLETMKARLSNLYLEDDEPGGRPLLAKIYPLNALATREGEDAAIALLDAWATVADVLTFYQERIANEGYLRTATERRSVMELARLVGYTLRPGVAASTYLAYLLETDSAVTIPAGSRAQSVPGPDETMQAFETSDDLPARWEWSIMRPRLTRPQLTSASAQVNGKGLYLKGITTNLKPNDAILIDFGVSVNSQALYRVVAVEADATADRTRVTLQPWAATSALPAATAEVSTPATTLEADAEEFTSFSGAATQQAEALVEKVREIVESHSKEEEYGDLLKTRTGGRVLEHLESLLESAGSSSGVELARVVNEEALPALRDELRAAHEGHFTRLEPWIEHVITELEAAIESAQASAETAANETAMSEAAMSETAASDVMTPATERAFASSSSTFDDAQALSGTAAQQQPAPAAFDLEALLRSLEKPASIPPANRQRLERSVEQTFSVDSDITLNLLTTLRPALASLLPRALENRPILAPARARVYAMRTRASVFGHNAPLRNLTDEQGRVTGQQEWTLTRFGGASTEEFRMEIKFFLRKAKEVVADPLPPGGPTIDVRVVDVREGINNPIASHPVADEPDADEPIANQPVANQPVNFAATGPVDIETQFFFKTKIEIGGFGEITHPASGIGEPLTPHDFNIIYAAASENPIKAKLEIPAPGDDSSPLRPFILTFKFPRRAINITIDIPNMNTPRVTSTGLDPFTFKSLVSPPKILPSTNEIFTLMDFGFTLLITGRTLSAQTQPTERPTIISLDAPYPQILPRVSGREGASESWVALEQPAFASSSSQPARVLIGRVNQVKETSRADYGLSLKGTQLTLDKPWLIPLREATTGVVKDEIDPESNSFEAIRGTTVFAQSELLELSEAPIDLLENPLCGGEIELDGFYSGLEAGRWLIVAGERADIKPSSTGAADSALIKRTRPEKAASSMEEAQAVKQKPEGISGLKAAELVMLAGVRHNNPQDDKSSTTLLLANALAYCYKLDTVSIYGNVAHATHGETRAEVLGSGDASLPLQTFTLKQPPLTFVSAPTVSGTETTLSVRVNDVLWHEAESLSELGSRDHGYLTRTDDDGKTRVIFGNGERGARPSTGIENITALYRNGIGRAGNVRAGQITLLAAKPLGVKEVVNPIPATGGADSEDRDTARRNAPVAVMSLDRLVSVEDYANFALTFAGIGKALAARLSDGRRQVVFLTIAGADDTAILETSDLYQNLRLALYKFGDPFQAVQIRKRRLKLLVASARVRVHPDYLWEKVEPKLRASMLEQFSFARREFGQDVLLSEIISAMQRVEGVVYVDVDFFGAIDEEAASIDLNKLVAGFKANVSKGRIIADLARVDEEEADPEKRIRAAELIIMTPQVPDTLILKEVKA